MPTTIALPIPTERYQLFAANVTDTQVRLNGRPVGLQVTGDLPLLRSESIPAGTVELLPSSITFLSVPEAENRHCL